MLYDINEREELVIEQGEEKEIILCNFGHAVLIGTMIAVPGSEQVSGNCSSGSEKKKNSTLD